LRRCTLLTGRAWSPPTARDYRAERIPPESARLPDANRGQCEQ
jgi:hypothetical protein